MDQTSAGLGQVVDARRISELPIREGTAVELVILAPGVTEHDRPALAQGGVQQRAVAVVQRRRRREAQRLHDRRRANVAADRVAYSPPSAAVEEFKIQTTTYDAAVGNTMGASVNLVTKSGTNSADAGRSTSGSAARTWTRRNYFDKHAGRPKRDYNDNRFGAAVGGPDRSRAARSTSRNVEANIRSRCRSRSP